MRAKEVIPVELARRLGSKAGTRKMQSMAGRMAFALTVYQQTFFGPASVRGFPQKK